LAEIKTSEADLRAELVSKTFFKFFLPTGRFENFVILDWTAQSEAVFFKNEV
jgi:hypothetical protein